MRQKLLTIAGTRPELIRLSVLLKKLPRYFDHLFVWTGQNDSPNLSTLFFDELDITPDVKLAGDIFGQFEALLTRWKPAKVLVLGDTYSGLLCVLATKHGIPVYHMEAGNRSYDERVPEERNRRIIDASATINMPYTSNSYYNLIGEGYSKNNVFKIGNPMFEVLSKTNVFHSSLEQRIWTKYLSSPSYYLATLHRADNIDDQATGEGIVRALADLSAQHPVLLSCHPRLKSKAWFRNMKLPASMKTVDAFGFKDFIHLERHAVATITDSGTVPEESAIMGVPCVITRRSIERQELVNAGLVMVAGTGHDSIVRAVQACRETFTNWEQSELATMIPDYFVPNVSDRVIQNLLQ